MIGLRALAGGVVAVLGLWLSHHVLRSICSGTANVHNYRVHRKEKPVYYWTAVVVQSAFAAACFFAAIKTFER